MMVGKEGEGGEEKVSNGGGWRRERELMRTKRKCKKYGQRGCRETGRGKAKRKKYFM